MEYTELKVVDRWNVMMGRRCIANCGGYSNGRESTTGENEANAHLIVSAVNACIKLNKDDPLAVAESIPDLYEALMEPNRELLEIGRKAIEDVLVERRDARLSEFLRGNGLVIREEDGSDSSIIRFGAETALRIGMKAIGQAIAKVEGG